MSEKKNYALLGFEVKSVIEIDTSKKYILQLDTEVSVEAMDAVREVLRNWVQGSFPFLVVGPGVTITDID